MLYLLAHCVAVFAGVNVGVWFNRLFLSDPSAFRLVPMLIAVLIFMAVVERPPVKTRALYDVQSVRLATQPPVRVFHLLAEAARNPTHDNAKNVWVVRSADRIVLVDAGF